MSKKVCPKCKGEMIAGTYTGLQVDWEKEGSHKFIKGEGLKINTYACSDCGFMESYVQI